MAEATPGPESDRVPAAPHLVLASASPRRAELLGRLRLRPELRPADIDESARVGESPRELVLRLAIAKATAAHASSIGATSGEVILAADTVVVLDGQALGKPADPADATRMLRLLSGRRHEVLTGVAVRHGAHTGADVALTRVTFRRLSSEEVAWYVGTGEPEGKAGGYGLQGAGAALVERLEGSDTNVIGLPLAPAVELLRGAGLDPLRP